MPLALLISGVLLAAPALAADSAVSHRNQETRIYNKGVALFREGDFVGAAKCFELSATSPLNSVAAKSRFNLGNSYYVQALASLEPSGEQENQDDATDPNPEQAVQQLQSAIEQYRSSLRLAPTDIDARANIELAGKLIDQIKQQQEQQQDAKDGQSSPEDSKSKDSQQPSKSDSNSEPKSDSEEKQQQQPDESKPKSETEQTDSQQKPGESQQPSKQNSGAEEEQSKDGSPEHSKEQPSAEKDASDQENGNSDRSSNPSDHEPNEDKDAQQPPEPGLPDEDKKSNPSDGKLQAANQNDQESKEPSSQQTSSTITPHPTDRMTPEEAQKLLQSIRDRDLVRRYRRRAAQRLRRIPVAKDW